MITGTHCACDYHGPQPVYQIQRLSRIHEYTYQWKFDTEPVRFYFINQKLFRFTDPAVFHDLNTFRLPVCSSRHQTRSPNRAKNQQI